MSNSDHKTLIPANEGNLVFCFMNLIGVVNENGDFDLVTGTVVLLTLLQLILLLPFIIYSYSIRSNENTIKIDINEYYSLGEL